jgi:predicted AAA+ superfamily ATPase
MQDAPTDPKPGVEAFAINTTGGAAGTEMERVCTDSELVISAWSPVHLRTKLKELYWKNGQVAANAGAFFEDTLRYLYMPRPEIEGGSGTGDPCRCQDKGLLRHGLRPDQR